MDSSRVSAVRTVAAGPIAGAAYRDGAVLVVVAKIELAMVPDGAMLFVAPPATTQDDFEGAAHGVLVRVLEGDAPVELLAPAGSRVWTSAEGGPLSELHGGEWVCLQRAGVLVRSQLPQLRTDAHVQSDAGTTTVALEPCRLEVNQSKGQCVVTLRGLQDVGSAHVEAVEVALAERRSLSSWPAAATVTEGEVQLPPFDATQVLGDFEEHPFAGTLPLRDDPPAQDSAPFAIAAPGSERDRPSEPPGAPWFEGDAPIVTPPAADLESTRGLRPLPDDEDDARIAAEQLAIEQSQAKESRQAEERRQREQERFHKEQEAAELAAKQRTKEEAKRREEQAAKLRSSLYDGFKRRRR